MNSNSLTRKHDEYSMGGWPKKANPLDNDSSFDIQYNKSWQRYSMWENEKCLKFQSQILVRYINKSHYILVYARLWDNSHIAASAGPLSLQYSNPRTCLHLAKIHAPVARPYCTFERFFDFSRFVKNPDLELQKNQFFIKI